MNKPTLGILACLPIVAIAFFIPNAPQVKQNETKVQVLVDEPVSVVLPEVTVFSPKAAPRKAPKARPVSASARRWVCSNWKDSDVGGQYKSCEWEI